MTSVNIKDVALKSKILLLDIEGTTSSIRFVKDTLFPYAADNVADYLEKNWDTPEVASAVSDLRKEASDDVQNTVLGAVSIPEGSESKNSQIKALVDSVRWQISIDRKTAPLKNLQALIWKSGFESGDIKGHVYDDVADSLKSWKATTKNKEIYIYSSGAVLAQKLLFGNSVKGNLLDLFTGYFDTAIGGKQQAQSYRNIINKVGVKSSDFLFLTDVIKEAEAAKESGMSVFVVERDGNAPLTDDEKRAFPRIETFADLI